MLRILLQASENRVESDASRNSNQDSRHELGERQEVGGQAARAGAITTSVRPRCPLNPLHEVVCGWYHPRLLDALPQTACCQNCFQIENTLLLK